MNIVVYRFVIALASLICYNYFFALSCSVQQNVNVEEYLNYRSGVSATNYNKINSKTNDDIVNTFISFCELDDPLQYEQLKIDIVSLLQNTVGRDLIVGIAHKIKHRTKILNTLTADLYKAFVSGDVDVLKKLSALFTKSYLAFNLILNSNTNKSLLLKALFSKILQGNKNLNLEKGKDYIDAFVSIFLLGFFDDFYDVYGVLNTDDYQNCNATEAYDILVRKKSDFYTLFSDISYRYKIKVLYQDSCFGLCIIPWSPSYELRLPLQGCGCQIFKLKSFSDTVCTIDSCDVGRHSIIFHELSHLRDHFHVARYSFLCNSDNGIAKSNSLAERIYSDVIVQNDDAKDSYVKKNDLCNNSEMMAIYGVTDSFKQNTVVYNRCNTKNFDVLRDLMSDDNKIKYLRHTHIIPNVDKNILYDVDNHIKMIFDIYADKYLSKYIKNYLHDIGMQDEQQ